MDYRDLYTLGRSGDSRSPMLMLASVSESEEHKRCEVDDDGHGRHSEGVGLADDSGFGDMGAFFPDSDDQEKHYTNEKNKVHPHHTELGQNPHFIQNDFQAKTAECTLTRDSSLRVGMPDANPRRAPRKSPAPRRSACRTDPRFKGATIWLQTEYHGGHSQLKISAFYSNVSVGHSKRRRLNSSTISSPETLSGSDTEETTAAIGREHFMLVKTCASCRTRRTPLWRDAEDGTPLCNACGIRYKKYRLRCSRCWHIPKKDIKTYPNCPCCGAALKFSFSRRAW